MERLKNGFEVNKYMRSVPEQEYSDLLQRLEDDLNNNSVTMVNKALDDLFSVKPVRLKWFILKAKAMEMSGENTNEIKDLLFTKYQLLYDDDNIYDLIDFFAEEAEKQNNIWEKERLVFQKHVKILNDTNNIDVGKTLSGFLDDLRCLQNKYIQEKSDTESIYELIKHYYVKNDYISYFIFLELYKKLFKKNIDIPSWILRLVNVSYFRERLDMENKVFTVVADESNLSDCFAAAKALNELGHTVYVLDYPQKINVYHKIKLSDTLPVSIDNIEVKKNYTLIHPVSLICDDKNIGDNRDLILEYINKNYTDDGLSVVISSGTIIDDLCDREIMKRNMERLYNYQASYFESNFSFGWCGDYLSYISEIYDYDVHPSLSQKSEYDFSIVIPFRNTSDTIKHTLQTCLNLRYNGTYEIILSDNSSVECEEIKKLADGEKVKYYKTPKELSLSKSFEFAFLKAKGEFIFSIGADDGVLPWCLDVLQSIIEKNPDRDIIEWRREFYVWPQPGFEQENEFVISNCQKDNVEVGEISTAEYINEVLSDNGKMYILPLLYINSGFRRRYMNNLLKKTGRLWDGQSQDIYMGLVNALIYPSTLFINYPLTIAGMSGHSIGRKSNNAQNYFLSKATNNCLTLSVEERRIPKIGTDTWALYNGFLRLVSRGLVTRTFIDKVLDMRKAYIGQLSLLPKDNILFDEFVSMFLCSAANNSKEFLKWFTTDIIPKLYEPTKIDDTCISEKKERCYSVGFNECGELILDASDFGVTNIVEAVNLYQKITGK